MNPLNYQTLQNLGHTGYLLQHAPERILQFGEGNFLRAFVDCFIDLMNERTGFHSKVVVVQPSAKPTKGSTAERLNEQQGLYTLYLRGMENGKKTEKKRIISCISRCLNMYSDYQKVLALAESRDLRFIISNTTEAGITYDPSCLFSDTPPVSYPAKLTQFLFHRFQIFGGASDSGLILLPCELTENNGPALKDCVLKYAEQWALGDDFIRWVQEDNRFCSTLVDRIVTGYPNQESAVLTRENRYVDRLMDAGELFASWVIEADDSLEKELPFRAAGLPVLITKDHSPYRERKVRILNGAHTSMVPGAFLSGMNIVRDCMHDRVIRNFMTQTIREEIIPTLSLPAEDCLAFADAVIERFENPYIDHALSSILLNSVSKWKTRVLPSLKTFTETHGKLPDHLTASFAFCLAYLNGSELTDTGLTAERSGYGSYTILDDRRVLEFFFDHRNDSPDALVHAACLRTDFWGTDLTRIPGFQELAAEFLKTAREKGCRQVMLDLL